MAGHHRGGSRPPNRRGLLDRVVRLRRSHAARVETEAETTQDAEPVSLELLDERLARLEELVEELQDSLHRRAVRHDDEIVELQRRTDPAAMARSLAEDARVRGL
jgi:hypothetical protein